MAVQTLQLTRRPLPAMLVYLAAVTAVASLGGLATAAGQGADGWYDQADKPFFTPPGALFGPVWTTLYVAMAVAAWRISRLRDVAPEQVRTLLRLWWLQLGLNLLWTPLFFAARWLEAGLVDILVLDVVVAVLVVKAWRVDPVASGLLAPYLGWVLFATALTAGFVVLN
ncbi:MAG TPA: TspO/MBR family protein [Nocardioidaceae bacterium]|nr:TspO/MBR family protein [Nocardioidaceae bacterium]